MVVWVFKYFLKIISLVMVFLLSCIFWWWVVFFFIFIWFSNCLIMWGLLLMFVDLVNSGVNCLVIINLFLSFECFLIVWFWSSLLMVICGCFYDSFNDFLRVYFIVFNWVLVMLWFWVVSIIKYVFIFRMLGFGICIGIWISLFK